MRIILLSALLISFVAVEGQKKTTANSNTVSFDQSLYSGIKWREIGPFRGGRSVTATGIVGNPNVYYFGDNDHDDY